MTLASVLWLRRASMPQMASGSFRRKAPVQPGDLVVLAVAVVVAVLGVAELVAGKEHGGSPAAHQNGAGVAYHAHAQLVDGIVIRRAFDAAVPASIVAGAVGVVPAVGFIVLVVVGVEVVQGKAVVAGDEVDAGVVACIAAFVVGEKVAVQVAGAGDAPGGVTGFPEFAF